MNKKRLTTIALVLVLIIGIAAYGGPISIRLAKFGDGEDLLSASSSRLRKRTRTTTTTTTTATPTTPTASFSEPFTTGYTVEETGSVDENTSATWWVNSGAYLYSKDGVGTTVAGSLSALNPWRIAYSLSNPTDTDGGYHPQNIFRLIQRSQKFQNEDIQTYFKIDADNLSDSSNRNQSNGLLLMTRYGDGNNLYYIGVRVDGTAIIKKKQNGTYYTMLQKSLGLGGTYDRLNTPNLLPHNTWLGLRAIVTNDTATTTTIKLYTDFEKTGNWQLVGEVTDTGSNFGGAALTGAGYNGIRTDFMDISFDDLQIAVL